MINVWTDGSCLGNPGPGGAAAVGMSEEGILFLVSHGDVMTTNNAMELKGIIIALESLCIRKHRVCTIHTDSVYCKNGIMSWIKSWKKNGWKTSNGGCVKNAELWKRIDLLTTEFDSITWKWVKAHAGHEENELVDKLARKTANLFVDA